MHEPRVSWLPPSAATAQVWAVEALIGQRPQRQGQSELRGEPGSLVEPALRARPVLRRAVQRWSSKLGRSRAWRRLALAERARRPGRDEA